MQILAAFPFTLALVLSGIGTGTAFAHGTSLNPPSRIQLCSTQGGENPENFRLPACRAAKAAVGDDPAPFYDPNAVNIADAAGRHRQIIPDGKLCSANNPQYAGLDLPRADWPTANLPSGGSYTFRYKATAPHKGTFEYYITKNGFDVTKPLRWSDLEAAPFVTATDPSLENGSYVVQGRLPARSGRHLIYIVWQRSDSGEAFYSCSDVVFDGSGSSVPAPTGKSSPATAAAGGGHDAHTRPASGTPTAASSKPRTEPASLTPSKPAAAPVPESESAAPEQAPAPVNPELARTGGSGSQPGLILAGAAAGSVAIGFGSLVYARRRTSR
ncbi:lytic polysaccharide monooxygenase [Embleya sp. NPDC005971]|uniref:lytic polysaccharide monooxygenase auxiliary activity family 9 protein n=1 Tax=Embleya sp. NPDC005971 TaxID=3156724 RepID=UPI0034041279